MKSIVETFSAFVGPIKEAFLSQDGSINGKAIRIPYLKNHFPGFLELVEEIYGSTDDYREILYCILKDIDERPKCKNPKCSNLVPLRKFHSGFQKFCCVECQNEWQRNSEEFKSNISKGIINKNKETLVYKSSTMNNKNFYRDGSYIIFPNFCKHGDVKIYVNTLNHIEENNKSFQHSSICMKCNEEIFKNYNPSLSEILNFQKDFPTFYKENSSKMRPDWWMRYYPRYWKILHTWFSMYFIKANNEGFVELDDYKEMYYVFLHKLSEKPICKHPNCKKETHFIPSTQHYSVFCKEHSVGYNSSGIELELEEYIKSFDILFERNNQKIIKGELDFYFPEKNLAIEFNGCWFHSDNFKPKNYHMNKWKECREKGIQLISIWEDDWNFKKDIVKSMLKSKLGLVTNSIGARECEIKEVSYEDASSFLEENHLQGNIVSKFRYGLFYKDELVQLVTFGNSRFKKGELELIRFCTKKDWQVIGGFSRLVKFFIKEHKVKNFISYANCDISDGKVYSMFGMKETRHTENWGWFDNGKRINRFNKSYRLNKDKVFHKCYTSGTLKFEYSN